MKAKRKSNATNVVRRSMVARLRMIGMVAAMELDGLINGDWFQAFVTKVLAPDLQCGDVVIMDVPRATSGQS